MYQLAAIHFVTDGRTDGQIKRQYNDSSRSYYMSSAIGSRSMIGYFVMTLCGRQKPWDFAVMPGILCQKKMSCFLSRELASWFHRRLNVLP